MPTKPRKQFAQHWLKNELVLEQIVEAAAITAEDRVLEIGPGTGILTRRLLLATNALVAVEIDRDLCKKLVKSFGDKENFLLLQGDILSLDLNEILKDFPRFDNPNKVVANIPYNITGPILEKLLGTIAQPNPIPYAAIVLLMQKEVAERLVASPSTKAFGALSLRVQYLAHCQWVCDVAAKDFYPAPQVDSAVVKLIPYQLANPAQNPRHLETLIKLGFSSRRKMLRNNLKTLMDIDRLAAFLREIGMREDSRAEDLGLEQWIALSNCSITDGIIKE
jgi:16S rRNA (adenine1518-N6/adenine1519-N6)-dimethyltransferase